jgi:hypothetical protein
METIFFIGIASFEWSPFASAGLLAAGEERAIAAQEAENLV